ncbi:MAG: type VI secretion system tube protein Hcp [Pseudomonadota bacterium]|nr:type VI secretion system tube protein Hcp [Pseudomonadota bacterium]
MAAGNAFIQFPPVGSIKGITLGESTQESNPGDKGWIEISDWSWDVEAESSFMTGGGSAVGKPTPGVFTFSKPYDISSPPFLKNAIQGTHFPVARLQLLKSTGDVSGKPQPYLDVVMAGVFITKVAIKGDEEGKVTQDVEFAFKEINFNYKMQSNTGSIEPTIYSVTWNVGKQSEAPDLLTAAAITAFK